MVDAAYTVAQFSLELAASAACYVACHESDDMALGFDPEQAHCWYQVVLVNDDGN